MDYVKDRMMEGDDEGNIFYLAKVLADRVLGEGKYEVLEEMKGSDMEYMEYERAPISPGPSDGPTSCHP